MSPLEATGTEILDKLEQIEKDAHETHAAFLKFLDEVLRHLEKVSARKEAA